MTVAEIEIVGPASETGSIGRAGLWLGAAVAALAAHGAVLALTLNSAPPEPADTGPPPAVMIELAPAPAAPEAETDQIAPDVVDTPEVLPPAMPMDAPDLPQVSEAVPATSPSPPAPAPLEPRLMEQPLPSLPPAVAPPEVAAPRPLARPRDLPRPVAPSEPETTPREPEPEPVPEPPSEQRTRAQAQQTRPADAPAASTSARGAGAQMSPAQWQSRLMAHLERRKRFPANARARRQEGVAQVRFAIDAAGNVLSVQLVRSSRVPALDEEAVAMIRRASPVPPPPPGIPHDLTVPVQFALR